MQQEENPTPEEILNLGVPRYTASQVTEKAGLEQEETRRLWRAMGFVLVPEDEIFFTDADLEVLQRLTQFMRDGLADLDMVLGITRAMSQSIARIAEAQVDAIRSQLATSPALAARVLENRAEVGQQTFGGLEEFMIYVWKRQLADTLKRAEFFEPVGGTTKMTVGFADLVGFTRLSRDVDEKALSRIIEDFESAAQEVATEVGARIVKTIGDAVMFVANEIVAATEMALRLVETMAGAEQTAEIRVGLATGEVVGHHGDYFGPTVNLASRVAHTARPNSVLVSEEVRAHLEELDDYVVKPVPRRHLKGIGTPQLYVLRRPD